MNIMKIALVGGLGLLALTACDDGSLPIDDTAVIDDTATDDTGTEFCDDCAPTVQNIDWSCDESASPETWTYEFELGGWAGAVDLEIFETGSSTPWEETHGMDEIDFADDGTSSVWGRTLQQVATPGEVSSGSTTLFDCGFHGADSLTWKVSTFDTENNFVECAVWGHDVSHFAADNCIEF